MDDHEQDGGPGPSIRQTSPRNPDSNHNSEIFARHRRHMVLSTSHQQEKRQGLIGLQQRLSRNPDQNDEDIRPSTPNRPPSSQASTPPRKRFRFGPWPRSPESDHSGRNESSLYESDSDFSIHPAPSPYNDSDVDDFRSIFSDNSSRLPRKRMKEKLLSLKDKLIASRPSFRWKSYNHERDSQHLSEPPRRSSFENQVIEPEMAQAEEHESAGRRSFSKARSLFRRCSFREKRKTWA